MADGDFCTVSQVKHLLPINASITTDDPLIQRLISSASEFIRSYCSDRFNADTYTEVRNGTGTNTLVLRHGPVLSVTSVSIGSPGRRAPLTVDTDFVFDGIAVQLLWGCFPKAVANIEVVYAAGYVAIPADLSEKAAKLAALRYKEADRLGQSSKSIAGETISFDTSAIPRDVKLCLDQYRRVAQVGR